MCCEGEVIVEMSGGRVGGGCELMNESVIIVGELMSVWDGVIGEQLLC